MAGGGGGGAVLAGGEGGTAPGQLVLLHVRVVPDPDRFLPNRFQQS